jgi:hypothetical protein
MRFLPFVLLLVSLPAFSDALPEVKIEPQWVQCTADTDCVVLRDACRSCGEPIALNKDFIDDYLKVDYAQRVTANVMLSCEACSQLDVKVSCENQQCKAVRN